MPFKQAIPAYKLNFVRNLYVNKKLSMREIGENMNVSIDAVTAFFRRHDIPRRSYEETQKLIFDNKPLSFSKQKLNTAYLKELSAIGTMLYWAEGYKGDETNCLVDFANSDTLMIQIFLRFLREIYLPDEKRLRIYLYCYSNQNVVELINYWSKITKIPKSQFSKPYIRSDFKEDGRKMKYGMIHVRYNDKKLLLDIKSMIKCYVKKYAPVG